MKTSRSVRWSTILLLILLPLLTVGSAAQEQAKPTEDRKAVVSGELGAKLDQYLTRLARFGFSGAVLVAKDGKVLLQKGYGFADEQHGIANTTQTAFDIASLTKQFTATAILKLESQGKLKTSDLISKYLPNIPADKTGITIHHLLTHTSGFDADFTKGKNITREQFVTEILKMPLVAEPGKQHLYANSGYCLLAAIIEVVSNQPYHKFMADLFGLAGMTNTGAYDDRERWQGVTVAHGYNDSTDNGLPTARPGDWGVRGAYDALTTVGDLYKWITALRKETLLPGAQVKKMFSAQVPTGEPGLDYGYGWLIGKTGKGKNRIHHDGSHFEGFNASCRIYPDDNVVVIMMTNRLFGRYLPISGADPAINSILFEGKTPAVPDAVNIEPNVLTPLAGNYVLPAEKNTASQLMVIAENDHLKISAVGQDAIDMLTAATPEERKLLANYNKRAEAVFSGIARGDFNVLSGELRQKAEAAEFKQAAEALWQRFETKHGTFKSIEPMGTVPETDAVMTYVKLNFERGSEYRRCRWEGGKLAYILQGAPPLLPTRFVPQSKTEFSGYHVVIGRAVKIRFDVDGDGKAISLTYGFPVNGKTVTATKTQ